MLKLLKQTFNLEQFDNVNKNKEKKKKEEAKLPL